MEKKSEINIFERIINNEMRYEPLIENNSNEINCQKLVWELGQTIILKNIWYYRNKRVHEGKINNKRVIWEKITHTAVRVIDTLTRCRVVTNYDASVEICH